MKTEMANQQGATSNAVDLARECLYRFLAAAVTDPYAPGWDSLLDPASQQLASQAAALLREESGDKPQTLAFGELPSEHLDADPLVDHLHASRAGVRSDYDRIFGLVVPRECPPYETEYHRSADAFYRAQQLADVAGFYRAFGVDPATSRPERADHIALELEFMALLITKQRLAAQERDVDQEKIAQLCADAQRKFFAEHLAWWVPSFATGLGRKAEHGFYAALAKTLSALIAFDRFHFGVDAPQDHANPSLIERPEEQSGCAACPLSV